MLAEITFIKKLWSKREEWEKEREGEVMPYSTTCMCKGTEKGPIEE